MVFLLALLLNIELYIIKQYCNLFLPTTQTLPVFFRRTTCSLPFTCNTRKHPIKGVELTSSKSRGSVPQGNTINGYFSTRHAKTGDEQNQANYPSNLQL